MGSMDMAEDMELWPDAPDSEKQLMAASMDSGIRRGVQNSVGWPMSDEDIDVVWDLGIESPALFVGIHTKSSAVERRNWGTPYAQTIDLHILVDEDCGVAEAESPDWISFEEEFMVAGDDNFVAVRLLSKPPVKVLNLGGASTEHGQVAGMDQDVTKWNGNFLLQLVRVAQEHQTQFNV